MSRGLSGHCAHANALVRQGKPAGGPQVEGFHDACRGTWWERPGGEARKCDCLCHAATGALPLEELVRQARRQRMIEAGVDPDGPARARGDRRFCKHDHEMTEENTGPRGECRACKRIASQRCKARRAEREAQ